MSGAVVVYRWTAEAVALARREHLAGRTRTEIGRMLGVGPRVVARKIEALGLAKSLSAEERRKRKLLTTKAAQAAGIAKRAADGEFIWTPQRLVELRRAYVIEEQSVSQIAAVLGCRPHDVSRKVHLTGMTIGRSDAARRRERSAAQALATEARRAKAVRIASDAELIAKAVADGRVTRIPDGHACGISAWERALWTSGPISGRFEQKPARGAAIKRLKAAA